MKRTLLCFAVLSLALPSATAAGATETERISQRVKLAPGGSLHLKSFSGRVTITGTDGDEVVIDAVRRATRDRLDHIKLDIRSDGSAVYIDANRRDSSRWLNNNNVVETDFDIRVPRRTNVDLKVFSAPVTVDGVDGRHDVGGFSSPITLLNVVGPVKAHTFSGAVQIQARDWQADQNIEVETFSGDVTLRVPEGAAGQVAFNSFSGSFDSSVPLAWVNGRRTNVKAELGSGTSSRGTLRFKTFSGSVRIDR